MNPEQTIIKYPALHNAILKDDCYIHIYESLKRHTRIVEVIKREVGETTKKDKPKIIIKGNGESDFLSKALARADLSYSRGGMKEELDCKFGAAGSEGGIDTWLFEGIDIYLEKVKDENFIKGTIKGGTINPKSVLAYTIDDALRSICKQYEDLKAELKGKVR